MTPAPAGRVYFLHGDDEFRKDQAVRELVTRHLDPATADFNYDLLRGSEVSLETLASTLGTPPMMAECRVVVVREAEALASHPGARKALVEAARNPPPRMALILVASIPSGSKARFYADLQKAARSTEFRALSPDDLPGWLMERSREHHGIEMRESAARALASAVGADLGILAQELRKLADLVGDSGPISVEHVERAGTRLPTQDRWAWFDLVGERRFPDALKGLRVLLGQGESAVGLAIGLGTHLLRLGIVADGGVRALEQALPPHQRWLARRLGAQGRRWSVEEIDAAIAGLRRTDQLLKASTFSGEHLLEEWLFGLATRESEAA